MDDRGSSADEDVDIEGDFHVSKELLSSSSGVVTDYDNDINAQSVDCLSDDVDSDSRAAILQILDQKSCSRKPDTTKSSPSDRTTSALNSASRRQAWSNEDKALMLTGIEIYGRSWKDIAELLPHKTIAQVKSYGVYYFKKMKRERNAEFRVQVPTKVLPSNEVQVIVGGEDLSGDEDVDILNDSSSESDSQILPNNRFCQAIKTPRRCEPVGKEPPVVIPSTGLGSPEELVLVDHMLMNKTMKSDSDHLSLDKSPIKLEQIFNSPENGMDDDSAVLSSNVTELIPDDPFREQGLIHTHTDEIFSTNLPNHDTVDTSKQEDTTPDNAHYSSDSEQDDGGRKQVKLNLDNSSQLKGDVDLPESESKLDDGQVLGGLDGCDKAATEQEIDPRREVNYKPEYGVLNSNGELIPMPAPTAEVDVNRLEISDLEKTVHFEFFCNRSNKTPDRYLRIRNYIVEQWHKNKPIYLKKTSVRTGLKSCGDVNCIGRIHAYLEQLGAINFGCEQSVYKRLPMSVSLKTTRSTTTTQSLQSVTTLKRKRRQPKSHQDYYNMEGMTTEHHSDEESCSVPKSRPVDKSGDRLDSYNLIKCLDFVESKEGCPYQVLLESAAASIMDIHAHLCKTEVIGLLGGLYDEDGKCLKVLRAEPCSSHSTSINCDMDPVSQIKASQLIHSAGLSVVGWYHSHPNFVPEPSKQDMESQEMFQQWFSKSGYPFLGVIVSPYDIANYTACSTIRCFTTAPMATDTKNTSNQTKTSKKKPFRFDYQIYTAPDHGGVIDLVPKVCKLLNMHQNYPHLVDMLDTYRSTSDLTSLDKMLVSIESHLQTVDPKKVDLKKLLSHMTYVITQFYDRNG